MISQSDNIHDTRIHMPLKVPSLEAASPSHTNSKGKRDYYEKNKVKFSDTVTVAVLRVSYLFIYSYTFGAFQNKQDRLC